MDKPMTFNEWLGTQGNMVLLHANCCRIAFEAGQQSQQAKVEELEGKLKQAYEDVDTFATAHEALEKHVERDRSIIQFTQRANKDLIAERDELQKRVDAAIKCADLNFWNANTVKAMVEALKGEG
ncbi:hypothetical protein JUNP543_1110 [Acinetobacter baumannii]|uniref:hypothetical protein n=1 Tax=Acinetobacter baumannii TaxID=470 RepID=UPI00066EEA0A|nr:hypothetical protein [Acinetobacter baumannii]KMV09146.1 hypothetical protein AB994_3864 [Acinetobacter baumannii]HAV6047923.1 hypothetical protein [Acinetobacter baumannii]HAV6084395.1 hypothetical protein [Acinetobacter baumannii]HAV6100321.1 hypothetical protein [Acinetobacter baumannii]HAV6110486.1 hypothetical protein [Acinetobacter baumannii]